MTLLCTKLPVHPSEGCGGEDTRASDMYLSFLTETFIVGGNKKYSF